MKTNDIRFKLVLDNLERHCSYRRHSGSGLERQNCNLRDILARHPQTALSLSIGTLNPVHTIFPVSILLEAALMPEVEAGVELRLTWPVGGVVTLFQ